MAETFNAALGLPSNPLSHDTEDHPHAIGEHLADWLRRLEGRAGASSGHTLSFEK